MSSLRMIHRQLKREKMEKKYRKIRDNLRCIINDKECLLDEKETAQRIIQKLPRDSNKCRLRNRCFKTGRGNGVYRIVGLCRNMFRYHAMRGDIPGLRKASW